jgi:hypothetical protein
MLVENEPRLSNAAIAERLEGEARRLGRDDPPSVRTVQRISAEYRKAALEERIPYRTTYWPESFLIGALPWEASAALLEFTRWCVEHDRGRPTNRAAIWLWRLRLAAPEAPVDKLADHAITLGVFTTDAIPPPLLRLTELYLRYRGWEEEERVAWQKAREHDADFRAATAAWAARGWGTWTLGETDIEETVETEGGETR